MAATCSYLGDVVVVLTFKETEFPKEGNGLIVAFVVIRRTFDLRLTALAVIKKIVGRLIVCTEVKTTKKLISITVYNAIGASENSKT